VSVAIPDGAAGEALSVAIDDGAAVELGPASFEEQATHDIMIPQAIDRALNMADERSSHDTALGRVSTAQEIGRPRCGFRIGFDLDLP
jgi:hypothetical protein